MHTVLAAPEAPAAGVDFGDEVWKAVEVWARKRTLRAYLRVPRDRLFDPGPHAGATRRDWDALDHAFWRRPVGVVPIDAPQWQDLSSQIVVGVCGGCQRSPFGGYIDFVVTHFGSVGVSTHRSPLNLEYIHVMPELDWIVDYMWPPEQEMDW